MIVSVDSPTGHFSIRPIPPRFFFDPSPFGNGGMLVLNSFPNNSSKLVGEHHRGIKVFAAQAKAAFLGGFGAGEFYGITDRTGSESYNFKMSQFRAANARDAVWAAMDFNDERVSFVEGLGERFAAEYFAEADNSRHGGFRGVACYVWPTFATGRDPGLRIEIAAAGPPEGGGAFRRTFLAALHMGRRNPECPFR
jgi:hypothetical protein